MKDVQACEKRGGAGKGALIPRCPNGETHPFIERFRRAERQKPPLGKGAGQEVWRALYEGVTRTEYIGARWRTRRTETSQ